MYIIKNSLFICLFVLNAINAQTSSKMIKVVKYKSSWKAYRSGVEIPRSHFFRILNDQKKWKNHCSMKKIL